jgi:hypothetical protein
MKRRSPARRQAGAALLALLAVLALGASWFMVSRLEGLSQARTIAQRNHNAVVLNRAKLALIGYVAAQALKSGENDPGALPCPEAAGYFDSTTQDGQTAGSCTLPKVGRFPWRTIGTEKLVDAAGEPLWYVVSPGWARTSGNTNINSNTVGQLTVDGIANAAVALIIAPGPPVNMAAATGCTAISQVRPVTGTPDWRNYLECENATSPVDALFVTTGPSASFNDQVLVVTAADVLPGIEAAIAKRIEGEIAPALKLVYTPATWGFTGSSPIYPFAAPFANPGPGAGTSSFQGAAATYQGLLPFNQIDGCTASASDPRCLPSLIAWQATPANATETLGYGYIQTQSCVWRSSGEIRECTGEYHESDSNPARPIRIEMTATFSNVAMGLRALDASKMTVEAKDDSAGSGAWRFLTVTYTATMNNGSVAGKPAGSVTITFGATMPNIDYEGWGTFADFRIRIDRAVITDHALLSSSDTTTGWFVRNEWYRLVYYAVAQGHTAATLPPSCVTGASCLSATNVTPAGSQRALLILAGRSLTGATRPNANLSDFLDSAENRNGNTTFEQANVGRSFNDRIVVIDRN